MIFITAAVFLFGCTQDSPQLLLSNAEDGEVYASYPLGEGDSFAVEFIHSVNKSPVRDVYTIQDGAIWNEECIYYEQGEMVISGIHKPMDDMILVVGTVSDHTLYLGEETISLRDLCGRNSKVLFQYKEG